jgi:hypothetical protein
MYQQANKQNGVTFSQDPKVIFPLTHEKDIFLTYRTN